MISTLVFESRLPVGSSPRITCGSLTRLRAMATRCCWPPESCSGRWSSRSPRPTSLRQRDAAVLRRLVQLDALVEQRHLDVLDDRVLRQQVVRLKDEAEVGAADLGELVVVHPGDVDVAQEVVAAGRPVEAAEDVEERGLAGAGRPHEGDEVALVERRGSAP